MKITDNKQREINWLYVNITFLIFSDLIVSNLVLPGL